MGFAVKERNRALAEAQPSPSEGGDIAGRLSLRNLSAKYGKREILRGVSLNVRGGEIVALVGPNGAGKSTLLKVVSGFLKASGGAVLLDGGDITNIPPHVRVRQGIQYFMQGGHVFQSLTVKDNLLLGVMTSDDARARSVEMALEFFPKLRELYHRRAGLLSGGERQSLALAMSLVKRPHVLLLDEPSAGLSPILAQWMMSKVADINERWNMSVLLVEQNVRAAVGVADRLVALVRGQVALESCRPKEVLGSEELERIFMGDPAIEEDRTDGRETAR